ATARARRWHRERRNASLRGGHDVRHEGGPMLSLQKLLSRATIGFALTAVTACGAHPPTSTRAGAAPAAGERGRQLATIGGGNDCHTPMKFAPEIGMPVPDMSRMLSGPPEGAPDPASNLAGHDLAAIGPTFTAFRLPFGVVYTANLTPDAAT